MPKKTTEERLATLEAQVQGLADHLAEDVHGWHPAYRMEWCLLGEETKPQWTKLYDWRRDPEHPLHEREEGASVDA